MYITGRRKDRVRRGVSSCGILLQVRKSTVRKKLEERRTI